MPSRFLQIAAISALVACFLAGCSTGNRAAKEAGVKPDRERKTAPAFTLKDADGKSVSLSDYRGKVVLLDFWATWCDPCKLEIPWFEDLQRKDKDRGFAVLGISMDDDGWDVVKPFIKRLGVNYRVLLGDDETAQLYGGVDSLPTTFLIDRAGRIAAVYVGLGDRKEFDNGVEELLRVPSAAVTGRAAVPALLTGAN